MIRQSPAISRGSFAPAGFVSGDFILAVLRYFEQGRASSGRNTVIAHRQPGLAHPAAIAAPGAEAVHRRPSCASRPAPATARDAAGGMSPPHRLVDRI